MRKSYIILLLLQVALLKLYGQSVGIGTTSPNASAQLDVNSINKGLLLPRLTLAQRNNITSPATGLIIYQTDNTPGFYYYDGSSWSAISSGNSYWASVFGSNIFYNAGNVSVGGLPTVAKMNVIGDQMIYGNLPLLFFRHDPNASTSQIRFQLTGGTNEFGITHYSNRLYLSRMNGLTVANDLVISNTGFVGIGVPTPSAKLQVSGNVVIGTGIPANGYLLSVNGKIISEEVRVELGAAWPDYVFDKEYSLPSLQVLEKYIKQQKHLPNIPAAAQVEKEGISLGDMNRRLLEKIEELTLYLIEQDKKISSLQQQINLSNTAKQ